MKLRNKHHRTCIYCQSATATTTDHVPPKNLFPKPRPQLISVPCCDPCNKSVAKDDEYFRAAIINREDVPITPELQGLIDTVFRGLARAEAGGFRRAFLESISEVDLITKAGLYVGRGASFQPTFDRLESVATRIVRGLHFKEIGNPLPVGSKVNAWLDAGFDQDAMAEQGVLRDLISKLTVTPPRVVHSQVFQYWYAKTEIAFATVWLLQFYQSVWFLVQTVPAEIDRPPKATLD